MEEVTVLTPTGCLGNGPLDEDAFETGMRLNPDCVALDAGSLDPGPYYLGAGVPHVSRSQAKRDLEVILPAAKRQGIPVIIGTAGGSGASANVAWNLELVKEACREQGIKLRTAVIYSDIDKSYLIRRAQHELIPGLGTDQALTPEMVEACTNVVAAMGVEPFARALAEKPDLILAGRACDDAVIAALPVYQGCDKGLALHMGSILECAGLAAEWKPGLSGRLTTNNSSMLGRIGSGYFEVTPANPDQQATVQTIVAHSLYERRDPYRIQDPGGVLDLTRCEFEQIGEASVRVRGSRFIPDRDYTLKLEGARPVGFRSISICGVRDPIMVSEIDYVLETVRQKVGAKLAHLGDQAFVNFVVYGRDGVMSTWEPDPKFAPHELGLVIDIVSPSQKMAHDVGELVRALLLFQPYPGRLATAGNLAFPFNPRIIDVGPVYEISIHHALTVEDPCQLFQMQILEIQ